MLRILEKMTNAEFWKIDAFGEKNAHNLDKLPYGGDDSFSDMRRNQDEKQ